MKITLWQMRQNHDAVASGSTLVSRALLRRLSHSLPRRGSDFMSATRFLQAALNRALATVFVQEF